MRVFVFRSCADAVVLAPPSVGSLLPSDNMGVGDMLKKVDAFPKTLEEFRVRTSSGAAVSLCAMVIMALLFVSEVSYAFQKDVSEFMDVDRTRGEKLRINFDITFPAMPCGVVHLDAMDVSGQHQNDVAHHVQKIRLDKSGRKFGGIEANQDELLALTPNVTNSTVPEPTQPKEEECGSCYGAGKPGQCCSTCAEVRKLYHDKGWTFRPDQIPQCQKEGFIQNLDAQKGEGCNMRGYLEVPKVGGNFHFAPGRSFQRAHTHVHDLVDFTKSQFNISHRVNSLSFGNTYPDMTNPLDGYNFTMAKDSGMYQYYIKVVPTDFQYASGKQVDTNQYSVTDHLRKLDSRAGRGLPGVFFFYDISPIRVRIVESRRSFAAFLTSCCAIIGGVFTTMGIVDKLVYRGMKGMQRRGGAGLGDIKGL